MLNYFWTISPGGMLLAGQGTSQVQIVWTTSGEQWVAVNYSNTAGCYAQNPTTLRVLVHDIPSGLGPVSGPSPVCAGTRGAVYSVTPVPSAMTYNWSMPPGAVIIAGGGTSTVVVDFLPAASSGDIQVNATNICGTGPASPPFPVTVNYSPWAHAGPDTSVCAGTPFTVRTASAFGYGGLLWTTSGLGTLTDATSLSPTYSPATGETGLVILTIVAMGNPPCGNDTSRINLFYGEAAVANAGNKISSCGENQVPILSSAAIHYSSLSWATTGTGTFDDKYVLHPTYFPTSDDVVQGRVRLTLTAYGSALCLPDTNSMLLELAKQAAAYAGMDTAICQGTSLALQNSSAQNYISLNWKTSGSGSFDDAGSLHPIYTPSADDLISGRVYLSLTAVPQSFCSPAKDTLLLVIGPLPRVHAGEDGTACYGANFTVNGATASNYSSYLWTHNGIGILSGTSTLTPVYMPGPQESGLVVITLTANGTGACAGTTADDRLNILIHQALNVSAGPDQSIPYGTSALLSATASGEPGNLLFSWEPASLLIDPAKKQTETVNLTEDVTFYVHVFDSLSGCTGTDNIQVKVGSKPDNEECLVIHNVITPNGDGANDTWIIDCIESFPNNKVEIFNRWGDLVNTFEGYNNGSVAWKGTNLRNELLPDGTYYYVITLKNGRSHTGWVFIRGGKQ